MVEENTFEYTARTDERFSNDFREWPENYRKASDAGIAKLLASHPGAKVIGETSECVDETNSRFPAGAENKGKFFIIRTVEIDRLTPEAPQTAPDRLRAFEDKTFGKDAVRLRGQVERGYGSKFKEMPADQARHHAALEKLVLTEQALVDAKTALLAAKTAHDAAVEQVSATEAGAHVGE